MNVSVSLEHMVLFTDFNYHTYWWRYEPFCRSGYFQIGPLHDRYWPFTIDFNLLWDTLCSACWQKKGVEFCKLVSLWWWRKDKSITTKNFTEWYVVHRWNMLPMMGLELATPRLYTECSRQWAKQLKSYCWERVAFIQLVCCIIIYLSFLNCGWLLIREVQRFYWTPELLVPAEKWLEWLEHSVYNWGVAS